MVSLWRGGEWEFAVLGILSGDTSGSDVSATGGGFGEGLSTLPVVVDYVAVIVNVGLAGGCGGE
ncbi:hypothetical protein [Abyssogena phaseoliformis symbiont]|uniref:hypothetical protein n=1 Tax=Abyssogena phaseoliformis symbiont TaxID=596095 RepID=UPI00191542E6|nr:hypothetical protein [Abyssogena phaseoliformis symbiont]